MKIKNCVIVASGQIKDKVKLIKALKLADLIICADGGLNHLDQVSIQPDVLLGDFDSSDKTLVKAYKERGITVLDFPARKDATDSELAIDMAIESHVECVTMFGVTGTRLDHTLTNLHMLKKLTNRGIYAKIVDDHNEIYFVNKSINIRCEIGELVSIIPITETVEGIKTRGLEYSLVDETLCFQGSRGVSNLACAEEIEIEITGGEYFLIKSQD